MKYAPLLPHAIHTRSRQPIPPHPIRPSEPNVNSSRRPSIRDIINVDRTTSSRYYPPIASLGILGVNGLDAAEFCQLIPRYPFATEWRRFRRGLALGGGGCIHSDSGGFPHVLGVWSDPRFGYILLARIYFLRCITPVCSVTAFG